MCSRSRTLCSSPRTVRGGFLNTKCSANQTTCVNKFRLKVELISNAQRKVRRLLEDDLYFSNICDSYISIDNPLHIDEKRLIFFQKLAQDGLFY